jgi:hypothetical protein
MALLSAHARLTRPVTLGAAVAALIAGGASLWPGAARACSPPMCGPVLDDPPEYIFASPPNFPANAVRFSVGMGFSHPGAQAPTIVDANGAVVAVGLEQGVRGLYLTPTAPLPRGDYFLRYERACFPFGGPAPVVTQPTTFAFSVTGVDAPPPTSTGTLKVIERGTYDDLLNSRGAFVRVGLEPTPAMTAYLSLTRLEVLVDGRLFRGGLSFLRGAGSDPSVVTIDCHHGAKENGSPDSCGFVNGVGPGRHHLVVRPLILGLTGNPPAPAELDFEIDCSTPGGAGNSSSNVVDPPPPGPQPGDMRASQAGGCAIGGRGRPDAGLAIVLGLVAGGLALASVRRRRR